jgi:hypothetical protein
VLYFQFLVLSVSRFLGLQFFGFSWSRSSIAARRGAGCEAGRRVLDPEFVGSLKRQPSPFGATMATGNDGPEVGAIRHPRRPVKIVVGDGVGDDQGCGGVHDLRSSRMVLRVRGIAF